MRPFSGARYKPVEGLVRGLKVLRALNMAETGRATAGEISERTGLHRTTVRRLLETLISEGFIRRSSSDETYRLSLKVRELSGGFTDDEWIAELATPALGDLLRHVLWPSDLATLDVGALIVRETNHRFSSLSFHRNLVGRRLPLLCTAMGKAYFAGCSDEERQIIVRLMVADDDDQSALARDEGLVGALLDKVRTEGVATNNGEWNVESHIAALALPIRHGDRVLACMNGVYLKRAMAIDEAVSRYLPALRDAVQGLEARYAARADSDGPSLVDPALGSRRP